MTEKLNIGDFGLCEFKTRKGKSKANWMKLHVRIIEKEKNMMLLKDNEGQEYLVHINDINQFIKMELETLTINDIETLIKKAKEYSKDAQDSLQRNRHMNEIEDCEVVQQRHIDAVLVDFLNYLSFERGIDLALYTADLK